MTSYYTLTRMAKSQILTSSGEDKGVEQQEHSSVASGNMRWRMYFGKQKDSFLPNLGEGVFPVGVMADRGMICKEKKMKTQFSTI